MTNILPEKRLAQKIKLSLYEAEEQQLHLN